MTDTSSATLTVSEWPSASPPPLFGIDPDPDAAGGVQLRWVEFNGRRYSLDELDASEPTPAPSGIIEAHGERYMRDPRGVLVPLSMIKPQHQLEDEVVRKVCGYGEALSEQIGRFKAHTFEDVDGFLDLLCQTYGTAPGGQKGNVTLTTHDGLMKVQVQVADLKTFGAELQAAKAGVDECLTEWAGTARPEIRRIVQDAFDVGQEGKINHAALLQLLRLDIDDERWIKAMGALRDSMKVIGSKRYVRIYRRKSANAKWEAVSIDAAAL